MDAVTIDALLAETIGAVGGRYLSRPRAVAPHAIAFELSGSREHRLWIDAARGTAGLYRLSRDLTRSLTAAEHDVPGRTRQALLLVRKHLDGARLERLVRVPGERTIRVETGGGLLVVRLSGPAPAATLVVDERAVATFGEGGEAWPLPAEAPEREWDRVSEEAVRAALGSAADEGRTPARALLAVCPGLGPYLARAIAAGTSFASVREALSRPRPTLLAPGRPETWHDRDLAPRDAVVFLPIEIDAPGAVVVQPATWSEAAALHLQARIRGRLFEARARAARDEVSRRIRKLEKLEAHLEKDRADLPSASALRRMGEALLAAPPFPSGTAQAHVPDPYDPSAAITVPLDPRLSAPANADRFFQKARRIERAGAQVLARLADTRMALAEARARERDVAAARDLSDLAPGRTLRGPDALRDGGAAPRHYLTSRGLSIRVGRGAKENHHLTFTVARPDDLWLHARDVPGAHVILRDDQGRAGADDLREAAETAAFFSAAKDEARVDVHVTRRKHLRPARGGPGRVVIGHSDTLRVAPRDPEGRLRRR
jgi:hypothetical protein